MSRKQVRTEEQELLCDLTDAEVLNRARQASHLTAEIAALEVERKAKSGEYGAKLKLARTKHAKLSETVQSGSELQPVTCVIWADVDSAAYVTTRRDTGEQIDSRAMTTGELDHERQGDLGLGGDDQSPTGKKETPPAETCSACKNWDAEHAKLDGRARSFARCSVRDDHVEAGGGCDEWAAALPAEKSETEPLPAPPPDAPLADVRKWLRAGGHPLAIGRKATDRCRALITAIVAAGGKLDPATAEEDFGPLSWPGGTGPVPPPEPPPADAETEDAPESTETTEGTGEGSDVDAVGKALAGEKVPVCPGCGQYVENCKGEGEECIPY